MAYTAMHPSAWVSALAKRLIRSRTALHKLDPRQLAMFIWQGFLEATPWLEADSDRYGGQTGAASDLANAVTELEQALTTYLARHPDTDYPGVLDYEVSEPFGAWCRLHPQASTSQLQQYASHLVQDFFEGTSLAAYTPPPRPPAVQRELHDAARRLRNAGFFVIAPAAMCAADSVTAELPLEWRLGP